MNAPKTTLEILKTLTSHEAEAVRRRFGVAEKTIQIDSDAIPTNGNGSGGSGGTPVPAMPQK